MLKQLKWDAKDIWMRYGWTFLVIPLVFGLSLMTINEQIATNMGLVVLLTGVCAVGTFYLLILPNLMSYSWLNGNQTQLSFSIPVKPWQMLLSRFLLIIVINIVSSIFALQIIYLHNKHYFGYIRWLHLRDLSGIPDAVLMLCLINLTFILCNLFVNGVHRIRFHKKAFSWGISIGIYICFLFLMGFTGYNVWNKIFLVFLLVEGAASLVLLQKFAHMDG